MESPVECVPNFSEGHDHAVLQAIVDAAKGCTDVSVLDASMDPDHGRSVVTMAGPCAAVGEAVIRCAEVARDRIDLNAHEGIHPRVGSMDVCPFVPLRPQDMEACVELAHVTGRRLAQELDLPVYFYGEAALLPERRNLADVRHGGLEALRRRVQGQSGWAPDVLRGGGSPGLHPTAGASLVGARGFLLAFNVQLDSNDLELARWIAGQVRERDGGLDGVKALGLLLKRRGVVQVSMNLCNPAATGLQRAFEDVAKLAAARGVSVIESELIGLAPRAFLDAEIAESVLLASFDPQRMILEELL